MALQLRGRGPTSKIETSLDQIAKTFKRLGLVVDDDDAEEIPEGKPWYRAVYDGETPVGFVMLSWNVEPDPPRIIGPWFLWKLLIDHALQGRGYGTAAVRCAADIVRAEGGTELLTSYIPAPGNPGPFYERLGFRPTGELDENGEIIAGLDLTAAVP